MQYKELTPGTTVVKTGPGYLDSVVVNAPGTSGTLQVFDNITNSAPAIAGATAFTTPAGGSVLRYQAHFSTGLTLVVVGTGASLTVAFY